MTFKAFHNKLIPDIKTFIMRKGTDLENEIQHYYETHKSGIVFGKFFSKHSKAMRDMGSSLDALAYALQDARIIRLVVSPAGTRYVFPYKTGQKLEALQDHVAMLDREKALARKSPTHA